MKSTFTISVAGPISRDLASWRKWERLIGELACEVGLEITHSAIKADASSHKFRPHKPLKTGEKRRITSYSLSSVPPRPVTIIQDARLQADRFSDFGGGLSLTIEAERIGSSRKFLRDALPRLRNCVEEVKGLVAFTLPSTELAANYALGLNDVRDCPRARVLLFKPGGFLPSALDAM